MSGSNLVNAIEEFKNRGFVDDEEEDSKDGEEDSDDGTATARTIGEITISVT